MLLCFLLSVVGNEEIAKAQFSELSSESGKVVIRGRITMRGGVPRVLDVYAVPEATTQKYQPQSVGIISRVEASTIYEISMHFSHPQLLIFVMRTAENEMLRFACRVEKKGRDLVWQPGQAPESTKREKLRAQTTRTKVLTGQCGGGNVVLHLESALRISAR